MPITMCARGRGRPCWDAESKHHLWTWLEGDTEVQCSQALARYSETWRLSGTTVSSCRDLVFGIAGDPFGEPVSSPEIPDSSAFLVKSRPKQQFTIYPAVAADKLPS